VLSFLELAAFRILKIIYNKISFQAILPGNPTQNRTFAAEKISLLRNLRNIRLSRISL
jgi:hypothetical protein